MTDDAAQLLFLQSFFDFGLQLAHLGIGGISRGLGKFIKMRQIGDFGDELWIRHPAIFGHIFALPATGNRERAIFAFLAAGYPALGRNFAHAFSGEDGSGTLLRCSVIVWIKFYFKLFGLGQE